MDGLEILLFLAFLFGIIAVFTVKFIIWLLVETGFLIMNYITDHDNLFGNLLAKLNDDDALKADIQKEAGTKVDHELFQFNRLSGRCKHYCPDWDYMAIDETCPEFDCCTCDFPDKPTMIKVGDKMVTAGSLPDWVDCDDGRHE